MKDKYYYAIYQVDHEWNPAICVFQREDDTPISIASSDFKKVKSIVNEFNKLNDVLTNKYWKKVYVRKRSFEDIVSDIDLYNCGGGDKVRFLIIDPFIHKSRISEIDNNPYQFGDIITYKSCITLEKYIDVEEYDYSNTEDNLEDIPKILLDMGCNPNRFRYLYDLKLKEYNRKILAKRKKKYRMK